MDFAVILLIKPLADHPLFEWRVNSPLFDQRSEKKVYAQGRSLDLSKMCQSEGTRKIVVSFSSPVVGYLLKKAYKRGLQKGGHAGSRAPHDHPLPSYAPDARHAMRTKISVCDA